MKASFLITLGRQDSHVWSRTLTQPETFPSPGRLPTQNLQQILRDERRSHTAKVRFCAVFVYINYFPVRLCVFDALTIMSCWGRRGFVHLVQHCGFFCGGLSLKRERERGIKRACAKAFSFLWPFYHLKQVLAPLATWLLFISNCMDVLHVRRVTGVIQWLLSKVTFLVKFW